MARFKLPIGMFILVLLFGLWSQSEGKYCHLVYVNKHLLLIFCSKVQHLMCILHGALGSPSALHVIFKTPSEHLYSICARKIRIIP